MATVFFTEVEESVRRCLNTRTKYYGTDDRTSDAHKWLFQKMAWATATATGTSGRAKSLSIPTGGGLGVRSGRTGAESKALYKGATYTDDGRFLPKPHINSVKIANEGDFGTFRKCEVSFTVYSRADLTNYQPFFDIGCPLTVSYGWNDAGGAGGRDGHYEGMIYNFSYQVNTNGGFDCISYSIGKGITVLSGNITAGSDAGGKESTDNSGATITPANLLGEIKHYVNLAATANLPKNTINSDGIGVVSIPSSWPSNAESAQSADSSDQPGTEYYISLEKLVGIINTKVLQFAGGKVFDSLKIRCDKDVTRVSKTTPENLVSGNPTEVLFPGYGNYSADAAFQFNFDTSEVDGTTYAEACLDGDLSKAMINIKWLSKIYTDLGKLTMDNQKSAQSTIAKFFTSIFNSIKNNSGTRWSLALVEDPKNPKEILVCDPNYIDSKIVPYPITAVTNGGVCRALSLQAKIPSEMATAAYVSATSTYTEYTKAMDLFNKNPNEVKDSGIATEDIDKQFAAAKEALVKQDTKTKDDNNTYDTKVSNLQAALKRKYLFDTGADPAALTTSFPLPIDLSCTLDGIEGFIFGNVITTNYLPEKYQKTNIAFTIKNVEHTITGNDWTTTLNTILRIIPSA